jgi:hypothetical protein
MRLTILIVEDEVLSREVIKYGIEKYNSASVDIKFTVIGEAHSYETAVEIIKRENNITLVLLDIELIGRKTGFDIMKEFPDLSYGIICKDETNAKKGINNLSNPNLYFFTNKEGVSPDVKDILDGLNKFVSDKNKKGGFYASTLKIDGTIIYVKSIAIIAKGLLQINENNVIERCDPINDPSRKDDVHFYSDSIVESNENHKHLEIIISYSVIPLVRMIERMRLNPNDFIRVSQSAIVNLNYLEDFDFIKRKLFITLINGDRYELESVEDHFKDIQILDKIERHLR